MKLHAKSSKLGCGQRLVLNTRAELRLPARSEKSGSKQKLVLLPKPVWSSTSAPHSRKLSCRRRLGRLLKPALCSKLHA